MAKKPKTPAPKPRNPHARALRTPPFKPKVAKDPDAYVRRPRHRKPAKTEVESED
jgi:hypothetical protein